MPPRPDGKIGTEASRRAAAELGKPLSAFAIGPGGDFEEPAGCWGEVYGLAARGAVLIRRMDTSPGAAAAA